MEWIIIGILAVIAVMVIVIYNRLVALRQERKNAFADIETQLKLRYDLVPNLVETVKGYAKHESSVFEAVTTARASAMKAGGNAERAAAEGALGAAMMNLLAVAENYPQLKADQNFLKLQSELSDIENKIAAARRFFNNATGELNTAVEQFPAVLIAKKFGFSQEEFFEIPEAEKSAVSQAPKVAFN